MRVNEMHISVAFLAHKLLKIVTRELKCQPLKIAFMRKLQYDSIRFEVDRPLSARTHTAVEDSIMSMLLALMCMVERHSPIRRCLGRGLLVLSLRSPCLGVHLELDYSRCVTGAL